MRIDVVTIFPEYLDPLRHALLGRAIERGILEVGVHNLRDWAYDVHKAVDDTPFGGGPGMVMKPGRRGHPAGLGVPACPFRPARRQGRCAGDDAGRRG